MALVEELEKKYAEAPPFYTYCIGGGVPHTTAHGVYFGIYTVYLFRRMICNVISVLQFCFYCHLFN
jgi:hypothetical protein